MKNIFENAYFGKPYKTRNNGIAFYCRSENQKHCLMVNDKENDFILCMENGHVFDIDELDKPIVGGKHNGKTAIELYGWNREELSNFRLDIISEWQEETSEEFEKYADFATDNFWHDEMETFDGNPLEEEIYYVCQRCYHAGLKDGYRYRKEKEK